MSTFDGHLLEYPYVSVDRFNGSNLLSSVYFLSHCHKDHIEGILDDAFLCRLKTDYPNVWVYTSDTTKNLMKCDPEMKHLTQYVKGLPVHQPCEVKVKVNQNKDSSTTVHEETIIVTLISAGHCVGSAMVLFEGKEGTVLYTGDFRLGRDEICKVQCLHAGSSVRHLKSAYVDTTFCSPNVPELPSRSITKDVIIEIIKSWITKGANYMVHLKCKGKYGYEYIMKEVAKYFKMKIHVNEWRLGMYSKLPDMLQYFTTDPYHTQIHCCYYGLKSTGSYHDLPCHVERINNEPIKMITIIPSSLYFVKTGIPKDYKKWIGHLRLWRVVHSMHASYNEIREVIGYLRPDNIYPFVPPVDCQDIMVAYQRLQDLKNDILSSSISLTPEQLKDQRIRLDDNLQNKVLLSPKSATHQCISLGLSHTKTNIKSPPPMRSRKRRHNKTKVQNDNNEISEKSIKVIHKSDKASLSQEYQNSEELLQEAFGQTEALDKTILNQPVTMASKGCINPERVDKSRIEKTKIEKLTNALDNEHKHKIVSRDNLAIKSNRTLSKLKPIKTSSTEDRNQSDNGSIKRQEYVTCPLVISSKSTTALSKITTDNQKIVDISTDSKKAVHILSYNNKVVMSASTSRNNENVFSDYNKDNPRPVNKTVDQIIVDENSEASTVENNSNVSINRTSPDNKTADQIIGDENSKTSTVENHSNLSINRTLSDNKIVESSEYEHSEASTVDIGSLDCSWSGSDTFPLLKMSSCPSKIIVESDSNPKSNDKVSSRECSIKVDNKNLTLLPKVSNNVITTKQNSIFDNSSGAVSSIKSIVTRISKDFEKTKNTESNHETMNKVPNKYYTDKLSTVPKDINSTTLIHDIAASCLPSTLTNEKSRSPSTATNKSSCLPSTLTNEKSHSPSIATTNKSSCLPSTLTNEKSRSPSTSTNKSLCLPSTLTNEKSHSPSTATNKSCCLPSTLTNDNSCLSSTSTNTIEEVENNELQKKDCYKSSATKSSHSSSDDLMIIEQNKVIDVIDLISNDDENSTDSDRTLSCYGSFNDSFESSQIF